MKLLHLSFYIPRWTNNIMIKYEDTVDSDKSEPLPIENMIFVDFQYSCWTSPAVDLHYFLNTSLHESLRPDRFDDLIAYYHGHLEANLKQLGYNKPIPNFDQFKQQYLDKSFYGKNQFICIQIIVKLNFIWFTPFFQVSLCPVPFIPY